MTVASCTQGGGAPTMRLPHPIKPNPTKEKSHVHHTSARHRRYGSRVPGHHARTRRQRCRRSRARRSRSRRSGPRGPGRPARRDLRARPAVRCRSSRARRPTACTFPTPSQPAIGFSGIVDGRSPGEYLAMPDNGFGNKANSLDFELRAYYITPRLQDRQRRNGGGRRSASTTTSPSVIPNHKVGLPDRPRQHHRSAADRRRLRSRVDPARPQRRPVGRRRVRAVDPALQRRRRPARAADRDARRAQVTGQPASRRRAHRPSTAAAVSREWRSARTARR